MTVIENIQLFNFSLLRVVKAIRIPSGKQQLTILATEESIKETLK